MPGTTYTITCPCGNVHTVTCPGGGLGASPPAQPTYPRPRVPSGPLQAYRISLMDALPPDVFQRGGPTDPVLVHLDAGALYTRAELSGRHVILSHGGTVTQEHG
jgi:hypothetical protein